MPKDNCKLKEIMFENLVEIFFKESGKIIVKVLTLVFHISWIIVRYCGCTIEVVPKLSVSDQYRDSTFQLFSRSARKILFRNYWCLQAPLEIRSSNLVFHLQIVLKIAQVRKQLKRVMSLFFSSFAKGQRTKWTWKQAISWALAPMRMCLWWFLVKMETAGNWRWKIQKLIRISLKETTVISSASRAYSVWVSFFFCVLEHGVSFLSSILKSCVGGVYLPRWVKSWEKLLSAINVRWPTRDMLQIKKLLQIK